MPAVVINSQNYADYSYIIPYIRYCAEDRYHTLWKLEERSINDYEFIFITEGTGQFEIDSKVYNIKANDLILIKPDILHRGKSVTLPFTFLCIHFDLFSSRVINTKEIRKNFLYESIPSRPVEYHRAVLDFPEYTSVNNSSYIQQLLKRIIHENEKKPSGYNTIIKSLFIDVVFNLFRQKSGIQFQNVAVPEIQAIIDYIKMNYMHSIKLSDIASHIHLQPSYISSLFKRHTGRTVTDFIKMHRIAVAKGLLLETDRKIDDIAYSAGFYDMHHFSKVFKEYEGLTPSQYRMIKMNIKWK